MMDDKVRAEGRLEDRGTLPSCCPQPLQENALICRLSNTTAPHRWADTLCCKKPDSAIRGMRAQTMLFAHIPLLYTHTHTNLSPTPADKDKRVAYECSHGCAHHYHWDCYRGTLRKHLAEEYEHLTGNAARVWPTNVLPCINTDCPGHVIQILVSEAVDDDQRRQHWDVHRQEWDEQQDRRAIQAAMLEAEQLAQGQPEGTDGGAMVGGAHQDWQHWQLLAEEEAQDGVLEHSHGEEDVEDEAQEGAGYVPVQRPLPDFSTLELREVVRDDEEEDLASADPKVVQRV